MIDDYVVLIYPIKIKIKETQYIVKSTEHIDWHLGNNNEMNNDRSNNTFYKIMDVPESLMLEKFTSSFYLQI